MVRSVYGAISRGDSAAVLEAYDPDVTWDFTHSPFASVFKKTVYRGHDGIRGLMHERLEEAWGEFDDELVELIDAGDYVISVVNSGGRGRASGIEVERTHAGKWTILNGKVKRVEWFGSREQALEAAGDTS
ncbi:MAG: nuclear transport factor 2 family protein [Solirubrobacterales bacterium]